MIETAGAPPSYRITDLARGERPRERLAKLGAQVLSSAELLAILLRVGVEGENAIQVRQRLLQDFNGLSGLQSASYAEICAQHGIGPAKAAQIKAAIDLGRRLAAQSAAPSLQVLPLASSGSLGRMPVRLKIDGTPI